MMQMKQNMIRIEMVDGFKLLDVCLSTRTVDGDGVKMGSGLLD